VSALDDDAEAYMEASRHAATVAGQARAAVARWSAVGPGQDDTVGRGFKLQPVGAGWVIYSTATFDGALDPVGVCVEVIHDEWTDLETGEMVPRTRYRCLRFRKPPVWEYVEAADVDVAQLAGVAREAASGAALWLLMPLARRRRTGARRLTSDDIERIHDAWRLAVAIA
jgi:hypothetical protein